MSRAGPRNTIPPPSERRVATGRWPLQVLAGVATIGAAFLLMRCLNEGTERTNGSSNLESSRAATAPEARVQTPDTPRAQTSLAGEAADARFVAQLARSTARRLLRGTPYTAEVADLVATAQIVAAAALLETRSAGGDRDATVVLQQLRILCESPDSELRRSDGPASPAALIESELTRAEPVPTDLRRRIAASIEADSQLHADLTRACKDTRFDTRTIEQRLGRAAEAGHEASLWALGKYTSDTAQGERHLLSAAMLDYPAAQAELAERFLQESLQGDRRNRGRMNFWLVAAAKHTPAMKAKLGECILNGCNAQPPDSEAAVPLLRDATLLGDRSALEALATVALSDPTAPSDEDLYALRAFVQKLNDTGCYGAAGYPGVALESLHSLRDLGSRLSPHALQDAEELTAGHWRDHGAAARQAQGCD
jgi:hypothetical protein